MSGTKRADFSNGAEERRKLDKHPTGEKKSRRQKAGDIGRALRSIYDDTLRETVPDDFNDLLGKLS